MWLNSIGTRTWKSLRGQICHKPLLWNGEDPRRSKQGLTQLILTGSPRGQNMSQTSAVGLGGSKEVKTGLNTIGIRILEVCERSECVADQ